MHGHDILARLHKNNIDNGYSKTVPIAYKAALIPVLCVYAVYTLSTFLAFIYRAVWLKDSSLLERSVFLLSVHTICGLIFVANVLGRGIANNYPCFIDFWLSSFSYITWMVTFILFMLRYYISIRMQYVLAKQARINPVTPENMIDYLIHLQSKTHNILWANTPASSESLSETPSNGNQSAEPQIPSFLASPVNRRFSWLRNQLRTAPKAQERLRQSSMESEDSNNITDTSNNVPILIESNSYSQNPSLESASQLLHDPEHIRERERLLERKRQRAKIQRYFLLDSFYACVLGIYALILVGYLALMSTLFTRLKLSTIYYNCFSGYEFIPHVIITGIFNVIIGPVYGIIIWRYHDAYGIRNSLCFAFVLGFLFWSGALAWRLIDSWHDKQISASILYVGQIVFTHTLFITQPLVKSIRFARAQKSAADPRQEQEQGLEQQLATKCKSALDGTSPQSLLVALQDKTEHEAIRRFAEICFCIEMVTFLDVYQAFKKCAFQVMQESQINEAFLGGQEHCESSDFAISSAAPSIVVTESIDTGLRDEEHLRSSAADSNAISFSAASHSPSNINLHHTQINEPSRSTCLFGKHHLQRKFASELDHADSGRTKLSRARREWAETNKKNIHFFSVGIVAMLKQAFPNSDVEECTAVSERLRPKLCEIIKTFILPGAPLELNIDAQMVHSARNYVNGGTFSYHEIDEIKEMVIDLLYLNVYIRFRQSNSQK